jgi:hypothetical protein
MPSSSPAGLRSATAATRPGVAAERGSSTRRRAAGGDTRARRGADERTGRCEAGSTSDGDPSTGVAARTSVAVACGFARAVARPSAVGRGRSDVGGLETWPADASDVTGVTCVPGVFEAEAASARAGRDGREACGRLSSETARATGAGVGDATGGPGDFSAPAVAGGASEAEPTGVGAAFGGSAGAEGAGAATAACTGWDRSGDGAGEVAAAVLGAGTGRGGAGLLSGLGATADGVARGPDGKSERGST